MIWLWVAALAALTVAPLLVFAVRAGQGRGRQEAAMALHRAQLQELDRDLEEGRLVTDEHEAAKLEVQRRLLVDAALQEATPARSGFAAVAAVAVLVPAVALALYLKVGQPDFAQKAAQGSQVLSAAQQAEIARDEAMVGQLRNRLTLMDPQSPQALKGYGILGQAELSLGHLPEAADAWQHVLAVNFDPTLAAQTAEVLTEASGQITPEALALFKRALAAAPPDAPWRPMAQKRIAEARGS